MSTQRRSYKLKARAGQQAATRQRIVEVTAQLHEEVGPARTTIAEVARRAGVQRLTVYNHFPEDRELFEACGQHWLSQDPPPDPQSAFEIAAPGERLRAVLLSLYEWYHRRARGLEHMQRDRLVMPAFDAVVKIRMDRQMGELADSLNAGFGATRAARATIGLALDFWTWRRLSQEGLSDAEAAAVMVASVQSVARVAANSNPSAST